MRRFEVIAQLLVLGTICSVASAQEKKIRRDRLPPAVEKTVAAESEGATIKGFSTEVEDGRRLYEVEMIKNGHHRDVSMDRNGVIVEEEEEVSMDSLPDTVQAALKKAAGTGMIEMIESLTKNGKLVAYEGHVKHGLKRSEIQVGPQGEKLKRPE
jgi:hypothetical protein